jgi:hypothetical protein
VKEIELVEVFIARRREIMKQKHGEPEFIPSILDLFSILDFFLSGERSVRIYRSSVKAVKSFLMLCFESIRVWRVPDEFQSVTSEFDTLFEMFVGEKQLVDVQAQFGARWSTYESRTKEVRRLGVLW